MSNTKSKKTKSKTGLARCMELASDRKGLIFLSAGQNWKTSVQMYMAV